MSGRTTISLIAIALGLFAFIYFFERDEALHPSVPAQAPLLGLHPTKVVSLEVATSNQILRVERTNNLWRLTSPISYRAQSTGIESLLQAITELQRYDTIPPHEWTREGAKLKAYGLDPAGVAIKLGTETESHRLLLGHKTPLAPHVYAQILSSTAPDSSVDVILTDAKILELLPENANVWRDPMLMNLSAQAFNRVEVQTGARQYAFERGLTNRDWRISKPIAARANTNAIENLLRELQTSRVARFVSDTPTADLELYGLQTPDVKVSFHRETNSLFEVEFGKNITEDPTLVYARLLRHSNVVLVRKELKDLLRLPYQTFHDPRLVSFDTNAPDKVEIQAGEPFQIAKAGGAWQVTRPSQFPADPDLMQELFARIQQLQILNFAKEVPTDADLAQFSLAPPRGEYKLTALVTNAGLVTNIVIADLMFGARQSDTVYVRRHDESPVYLTSYGDVQNLPQFSWQLRHRQLWNWPSSNIQAIAFIANDATNEVRRQSFGWSTDPVANAAFDELALRLARPTVAQWVARGQARAELLGLNDRSPACRLLVQTASDSSDSFEIRFGAAAFRGNYYAAARLAGDSEPLIFQFPGAIYLELQRLLAKPI